MRDVRGVRKDGMPRLLPLTSDGVYSLLHAAGWSIGDRAYTDPDSGRLVWMVYCHRGEQQIVATAESQTEIFDGDEE